MALEDHLKIASTELMKAADLLKQEINNLKSEEADLQKLVNQDIARITTQLQLREKEVQTTGDVSRRSQGQTVINNLVKQIADARSQLSRDQDRIQGAIREKENLINVLNQQAKSLLP
jgi:chromosome segregation ATPase